MTQYLPSSQGTLLRTEYGTERIEFTPPEPGQAGALVATHVFDLARVSDRCGSVEYADHAGMYVEDLNQKSMVVISIIYRNKTSYVIQLTDYKDITPAMLLNQMKVISHLPKGWDSWPIEQQDMLFNESFFIRERVYEHLLNTQKP